MNKIRVTIWNEYLHEKDDPEIAKIYPEGIHGAIKRGIEDDPELEIRLAALRDPEQGLPDDVLNNTDVLLWWAHIAHSEVEDALVEKIVNRVRRNGMGFIALHSAHASKPFGQLVGTTGSLSWGDNYHEFMWTLLPQHPVAKGIGPYIDIESEEVYSEPFCIGNPDEIVFGSWFESRKYPPVQDAVSTAASERFSTSSPDMKPAVLIITLKYSRLLKMQFIGQLRQTDSKIRVCR